MVWISRYSVPSQFIWNLKEHEADDQPLSSDQTQGQQKCPFFHPAGWFNHRANKKQYNR